MRALRSPFTLSVLLLVMSTGCVGPTRPSSLDSLKFPEPTIPSIEQSKLPNLKLGESRFAQPVIVDKKTKTIKDVTISVEPGPYNKLKPFTRKWMADYGICMFRMTLTNNSSQTSDLKRVILRLVVGDERVRPVGINDQTGGDSSVNSGQANNSVLRASYQRWQQECGLSPESASLAYEQIENDFKSTGITNVLRQGQETFEAVKADVIDATTPKGFFFTVFLADGTAHSFKRREWLKELTDKYQKWSATLKSNSIEKLKDFVTEKRRRVKEIAEKTRFDLDQVRLQSEDLSSVVLLPQGDKTTVFLAFQTSPSKLSQGGKFAVYGVPVKFDSAGNIKERTNVEFLFAFKVQP